MNWLKTFTRPAHALLASLGLLFTADTALAECTYTIKGKLAVDHQLPELANAYGTSALKGVKVQISGKAKVAGVWGWYDVWDEVATNSLGEFSLTQTKNCYERRYKIEVKFQNDDLEVRHETATSSTTKVKWYLIFEDETVSHTESLLDIGTRTFAVGSPRQLDEAEPRAHADIWVAYQKAIEKLRSYGSAYAFTNQVIVKYPHNSDVVDDSIEASYANPANHVIYIYEDQLNVSTLYHELMHIWAYQHVTGELGLAWELMQDGSTHGLVDQPWVAFHEGFAEYGKDKLREAIFGSGARLPYNRERMSYGLYHGTIRQPVTTLYQMERHDMGWWSLFHSLTTPDMGKYTYKTAWTGGDAPVGYSIALRSTSGIAYSCSPPSLNFANVLRVFLPYEAAGYPSGLTQAEMLMPTFLDRAADMLTGLTRADGDSYLALVDPSETTQPVNEFCTPIFTPAPLP